MIENTLQERIDRAVKYIKNLYPYGGLKELLEILEGKDNYKKHCVIDHFEEKKNGSFLCPICKKDIL